MILRRVVVLVRFVRSSLSRIARHPQCALSTGGQGACCVLCLSLGPRRCAQALSRLTREGGISLEMVQWKGASSQVERRISWGFSSRGRKFGVPLELLRGSQAPRRAVCGTRGPAPLPGRGSTTAIGILRLCPESACPTGLPRSSPPA